MSVLPNIFSDPKLRARQDQLAAQWNSLWAAYQQCDQTPDSSFAEFATDRRLWQEFYDSGSDWSSNSQNATNEWQAKAKEWADKLSGWGCMGNDSNPDLGYSGIPGVKDPPPDDPGVLADLATAASAPVNGLFDTLKTIGWVTVGIIVIILGLAVYALTHVKASNPMYGSIG